MRHDGAPTVPFADELDAMVGIRIGHHYEDYGFPTGNGPYVGVAYKEMAGTKFVGLTLGYSMDMATEQTRVDHEVEQEPKPRRHRGRRRVVR
jgi:hypothetical protein